ncbi:MAG: RNA polymerase sigma factor, partial [Myxococcales bacterium]
MKGAESRPGLRLVRADEPVEGPEDSELLLAHLSGDPAAFGQLVRRYQKPVYRLALRYARDVDEAEELAQRTFMKAFTHAERMRPELP